ncbi:DUF5686 and carboxypeptidase regulatory-like domain-containing protein [Marinilongibacter aquaticus]|uniref:DUF5686 and carboxypeptidase-like regulatory domain-containing protein n=1 Tax=Marinilongibacter aquaticus TaxID=2975157 RepID=UPI0021BD7631|nr:DUF5686 and carboxypeptidase-like regulatory domain-containing protein [Marinilongibacter aquaticus]UBM59692.1 DUF5686 and carboxypeptidase regulatory-like domain-containing protein [Marinilongibacter aquaticus]
MKRITLSLFWLLATVGAFAQDIQVTGKVSDKSNNEPIPYASVSLLGTSFGTLSDFEGAFALAFPANQGDTLLISSMGFETMKIPLSHDAQSQEIQVSLSPSSVLLNEVVVHAGENPAWRILRKVVDNRKQNDYKQLEAYDYDSYNKVEIDANKISDKLGERKIYRKIEGAAETVGELTDDSGEKLIPMFISESYSHYYYRTNPSLSKEVIKKTHVKGIATTDGSLTSQLIGSTFQQYNFYGSRLNILNKNFSSPIANDWRLVYDYYLADSLTLGGEFVYRIEFEPKNKQDLAFSGVMWISKANYALVMIDATIGKEANLNFVDRIKIQQDLEQVGAVYFPVKSRVVIDVDQLSKNSSGLLLKFVSYNENISLNQPKEPAFFNNPIILSDDYRENEDDFWRKIRPESLSMDDRKAYAMIDSMKQLPTVQRITTLTNIATTGYVPFVHGVDIGPLVHTGAINNTEGARMRLGLRTNTDFSKSWVLKGYTAYGTKDGKWKGGGEVMRIFSKSPWSTAKIGFKKDLEQVGLKEEDVGLGSIFSAAVRFGTLLRPYYENEINIEAEREMSKGLTAKMAFRTRDFSPLYSFSYYSEPGEARSYFRTSELVGEITMARDQINLINDNERIDMGTVRSPTVTLKYILGLPNVLGSDFTYSHVMLRYKHTLSLGSLGKTYYRFEAGKIFGTVPYPILKNHLGNQTPLIITSGFNLMNYYEFTSDQYFWGRFHQDLEGLIFNRIPLIKKLKLRTFATGKILFGSLSEQNKSINNTGLVSDQALAVKGLDPYKPYIEMGYGISNIFKLFRVEAIHRLTYLDNPGVKKFGVKFSAEITL